MIADETNNNRKSVARKVNKYNEEEGPLPPLPPFCGGLLLSGPLGGELGCGEGVEDMEEIGRAHV